MTSEETRRRAEHGQEASAVEEEVQMWAAVFSGMTWPLHSWQILAAADEYGISPSVRACLADLPGTRYEDLADLDRVLRGDAAGR